METRKAPIQSIQRILKSILFSVNDCYDENNREEHHEQSPIKREFTEFVKFVVSAEGVVPRTAENVVRDVRARLRYSSKRYGSVRNGARSDRSDGGIDALRAFIRLRHGIRHELPDVFRNPYAARENIEESFVFRTIEHVSNLHPGSLDGGISGSYGNNVSVLVGNHLASVFRYRFGNNSA